MNNYTPAQHQAIKNWTAERDSLLREIGVYSTQLNEQKKELKDNEAAKADLQKQIAEALGRLSVLNELEQRHKDSISVEIHTLEMRKSRLESECTEQEKSLAVIKEKEAKVTENIDVLISAHDLMKDQSNIVNKVVGDLIEISTTHLSDAKSLMTDIRTIATEVVDKSELNLKQTNIVLEKLPKYIFELEKPIPIRRIPEGFSVKPARLKAL